LSPEHEYVTPDWSPDGRFLALREDQRTVTLWEWQADGTLRQTGRWPDFGLNPKFSPDGQRLLVSAVPNLSTVILDLETGEEFIVRWQHETFGGRNHNTWTADGQQVVFHGIARRELGLEERPLFRMPLGPWEDQEQRRAEGRPVGQPEQAIQLTDNQAQNWLPAVSPDNRSLAFMCDQGGTWGIYVTTLEGQPTVRLTDGRNPAWSPDGRFLTFESLTDSRLWQITLGGLDTCPLRVEAKPQEGGLLVSLTNRSDEPQSVNVTYRLFDGNSFQVAEGQVGQPDQTLQPEEVIECPLTLEGATKPGTYTVKITAVTKKGERVVELVDYEKP
jgi:dipeptidyl aminopeptidase/acylaminoacyl peptidase